MIDLVELRSEIRKGNLLVIVRRDRVYIQDAENEECIMVCDLKQEQEKAYCT